MSMTDVQIAAFQNAAGFAPQSSSMLWLSLVLVLTLLWCAWVMWTAYRGWASGSVRFGAFGGSAARVLLTLLVLMFFTLS
ncbi:TIGR03758 family integrating conjugative element protein [Pseudomonas fluorescens]|uniref:TIGR03758 family integrating conjugative element protein n=1 Tax=Pseudomonas TaxID=286 RepID=UPI00177F7FB2|nr:TIGR03758 family integrating conjugative element protein [Pseudomonas paracarnis]MBD8253994.1 TIGR03758 family integrating conjugative element protein [Pseudomonas fluorescens]MBH3400161.1 TIGR03758 family integrating conjugative element protein [Pseudomonas fluorescens]MDV3056676.1 TIGR03758 family integrating conjugative element protein [Pseudomonas paracarnis]